MCMADPDDDGPDIYRLTYPVARKDYRCSECSTVISKGVKHAKHTGLQEDEWWTFRICMDCDEACDWLSEECGGYLFRRVAEDIADHLNDGEERPVEVVEFLTTTLAGMKSRNA